MTYYVSSFGLQGGYWAVGEQVTMAFYFHWFLRHNINMRRDYCSVVFVKLFAEGFIGDSIALAERFEADAFWGALCLVEKP